MQTIAAASYGLHRDLCECMRRTRKKYTYQSRSIIDYQPQLEWRESNENTCSFRVFLVLCLFVCLPPPYSPHSYRQSRVPYMSSIHSLPLHTNACHAFAFGRHDRLCGTRQHACCSLCVCVCITEPKQVSDPAPIIFYTIRVPVYHPSLSPNLYAHIKQMHLL